MAFKKSKRHHYLSQAYLASFAVDRKVIAHFSGKEPHPVDVRNVAFEKNLNTVELRNDTSDELEIVSSTFDGLFSRQHHAWAQNPNSWDPSNDEWRQIIEFVAYQMARHPDEIRDREADIEKSLLALNDFASQYASAKQLTDHGRGVLYRMIARMNFWMQEDRHEVTLSARNIALFLKYRDFESGVVVLGQRFHCLIACDDDLLIVGDGRVPIAEIGNSPYKYEEIVMPLSPRAAAFIVNFPVPNLVSISSEGAALLNERVVFCARRAFFSKPGTKPPRHPGGPAIFALLPLLISAGAPCAQSPVNSTRAFQILAGPEIGRLARVLSATPGYCTHSTRGHGEDDIYYVSDLSDHEPGRYVNVVAADGGRLRNFFEERQDRFTWGYGGNTPLSLMLSILCDVAVRAGINQTALHAAAYDLMDWCVVPRLADSGLWTRGSHILALLAIRHPELFELF